MNRRPARLTSLGAASALLATSGVVYAATAADAAAPAAGGLSPNGANLTTYTSQQLTWDAALCPKEVRTLGKAAARTQCAKVVAPKDYSDPGKGDISLMVTRTTGQTPAAAPRYVFTNPGGPGGPAARFSVLVAALSPLGRNETVIGVDPRGTGESTPVSCAPARSRVTDDRQLSDADVRTLQTATRKMVDDCVAAHGDYLPYITTDNTARDQELVRRLLGTKTVDYYGVSAGTWLGARYATLFPEQVGRFVLDSNTDFTGTFQESFAYQPMGFQRRFGAQFVPWAARHDATYRLGSTPQEVQATFDRVRAAAGKGKLGYFTPNVIDNVMAQQMYSDRSFVTAAKFLGFLDEAADGDRTALYRAFMLLQGGSDSYPDNRESTTFMATTCNDTDWNKDPNSYVAAARSAGPKFPLTGYRQVVNPCAYWPYKATNTTVDLSKAPAIMMVNATVDPATPYEGAVKAHKASPNTVLLTVTDQGAHGAVLGSKNTCVTDAAYGFLTKGTALQGDAVCPGVPLPDDDKVYPVGPKVTGPRPDAAQPTPKPEEKKLPDLADTLIKLLEKFVGDILGGPHH
ncbi:alpha/beta hydrolase [Flexivirga sp. ID2601S]|uniref:Alpha/beta hydrolase n=1 Tax=Flexivirga aerilata TaxID=1656889 RepID=A0A849AP78_9MICO|nr:alpha/beta hydrolase [Flexivirga aerilata]NNG38592.1 alpha/beta hydrolase [Flexivirga aerilata]